MASQYDAVIIGGGHNGLVAANYLARAGYSVCVLERYPSVGGASTSEEYIPGYTFSTGAYVLSLTPTKILNDLDAWEHGVELLSRNPRSFTPFPDGRYIVSWEDREQYTREIARFSKRDAENLREYSRAVERVSSIMDQFILRRPPSWSEFAAAFNQPGDDMLFKLFILGSAADLAEYYFESPEVQSTIASSGVIGTFRGPREPGTAFVKLYHSMGMSTGHRGRWAYVRGAMGSVTRAYANAARIHGVEIRTGVEVEQIMTSHGRATGVVTTTGEEIRAKTVFSNADPQRTYLQLVERSALPDEYVRAIEGIQIASPVLKINLALAELPRFTALEQPGADTSWGTSGGLTIGPGIDYLQQACEEARAGKPSDYPFMNIHSQSAIDPSVAPEGKHTLSIFAQFYPYELAEGTWEERREEIAMHTIRRFAEYAPNILDNIIGMQVLGPPDIEARFGMTGGHIFHGEIVPEQQFDMRPVPGSSSYQGPIQGLYLCGSGAWPGGCVTGAPGHNAAHEAIDNLQAGIHD